ncbi:MAG TPA: MBL fold metallo-hydrolase [Terriglobia bacterium]|nr:MBL fold metallo-hydrolase [Terriglobia bacterium]
MKIALGLLLAASMLAAQNANDTSEAHVALAKTAAGEDYQNLFNFLCALPGPRGGVGRGGGGQRQGPQGPPDRSTWYAEPVKVFDNLYFVGQSEYSVWAVTTSEGIIVIDTIFDYAVEEEVAGGLKKLGLDAANIKYAIVTHAHPDHHGGAKFLQDRYGVRVIMSPADYDMLDRANGAKPKRDIVATDGQKLTLGDTTLTLYITPGHTPGTISVLIPVKDNGRAHLAVLWGGTGLNADRESLQNYIRSAQRFTDIVRQAGADIILSNHTDWDRSKVNLPLLAKRAGGTPNPYLVGNDSVRKYLKVAEECATARLMRLNNPAAERR